MSSKRRDATEDSLYQHEQGADCVVDVREEFGELGEHDTGTLRLCMDVLLCEYLKIVREKHPLKSAPDLLKCLFDGVIQARVGHLVHVDATECEEKCRDLIRRPLVQVE